MSDNSDDELILKKCLAVELPEDFDPSKFPQNGEEYLQWVMHERRNCKSWVTVDYDRNKFDAKQTFQVEIKEGCAQAPTDAFLPTKQWQIEKLEDFSKLRKFIELKNINGTKEISHIMRWKETVMSKPPAFMEIATLSQSSKIQLLQLISQIIGELDTCTTISDATGTWIYGLLATLDIPLSPGACYHLRELSRKCSIVRSRLSTSSCKNMYIQLNLFICIVSNYFKQLDLADPVT